MTLSTQTLASDMEEQILLPFFSVPCSFNTEGGTMEKDCVTEPNQLVKILKILL